MLTTWQAPGGSEEMAVRCGPEGATCLLVLPAWFDEANKTRHFTIQTMRALERRGIASVLPDLPGCNESPVPLAGVTIEAWREAAATAARHFGCSHVLAIRAGAMIAPDLTGFAYAPLAGKSALRALLRARVIAAKEAGRAETSDALLSVGREAGLELAGYRLGPQMVRALEVADLPENRLTTLTPGGPGLWLRAEPEHDEAQAIALAELIAEGLAQ